MATKKKRSRPGKPVMDPRLKALIGWLMGPGRTPMLAIGMIAAFAGAGWLLWQQYRDEVLGSDAYLVTPARVDISPLPPWIRTDIRAQAFRDASLDTPLSIMDPGLASRIGDAFAMHPWVAEVRQVEIGYPANVQVELIYRRPICMVHTPTRLLPVDAEGILLPKGDFTPAESNRYPRLTGIDQEPIGSAGMLWDHVQISDGVKIVVALESVWYELGLTRVAPCKQPTMSYADEPSFELHTRGSRRIFWGRAPDANVPGEMPVAEKIARLMQYKKEHGTLDPVGEFGPLDIRRLRPTHPTPRTAAVPAPISHCCCWEETQA